MHDMHAIRGDGRKFNLLTRLIKADRSKVGKLLALLYLLCVLAPSLGFAFSAGAPAASCLVEDGHGDGVAVVDEDAVAYVRAGHGVQDRSAHFQAAHDKGRGERSENAADHHKKSSQGQCCGMLCVNALAAEVAELINPPTLTSRWELAAYRRTADNDPAALYRPPNF